MMANRVFIDGSLPQWKGNLHIHTTCSDGNLPPQDAAARYKQAGYDFILLSDHEFYRDGDSESDADFVILTGAECSVASREGGLYPIGGKARRSLHFLIVFDEAQRARLSPYAGGERVAQTIDTGISSWNARISQYRSDGHLVVLCHPRWSRIEPETMLGIDGCIAVEVYNNASEINESVGESEYEWDYCLRRGKRLLAVATDDGHHYEPEANEIFGGFTMVSAPQLSGRAVTDALGAGRFYASSGPVIHDMRIEDGFLHMRFSPAQAVRLVAAPGFAPTITALPARETITEISWRVQEELMYFRPEVIAPDGKKAWAQPVFLCDLENACGSDPRRRAPAARNGSTNRRWRS